MISGATWLRTFAAVLTGAAVGLGLGWLTRSRPPAELVLENGGRVMHPVYVEPTQWWAYAAFAALGAVVALFAVRVVPSGRSVRQQ